MDARPKFYAHPPRHTGVSCAAVWPRNKHEQERRARAAEQRRQDERWQQERVEAGIAHRHARLGWIAGLLGATLTATGIIVAVMLATGDSQVTAPPRTAVPTTSTRPPELDARAAPVSSRPVLVESVSALESRSGDGTFALPAALDMTPAALADFNDNIVTDSTDYAAWYRQHSGAAVDFGVATITLRGNAKEAVRVVDLRVIKRCGRPLTGTFFAGYSQGSGDTVKLGFDLDAPDPSAKVMASTSRGLFALSESFFATKTVELAPGELVTLSVGAFTKRYACRFTLRLFVATSTGLLWQPIARGTGAFIVTAMAPPTKSGQLSGYDTAYALTPRHAGDTAWERVSPSSYARAGAGG